MPCSKLRMKQSPTPDFSARSSCVMPYSCRSLLTVFESSVCAIVVRNYIISHAKLQKIPYIISYRIYIYAFLTILYSSEYNLSVLPLYHFVTLPVGAKSFGAKTKFIIFDKMPNRHSALTPIQSLRYTPFNQFINHAPKSIKL